MTITGMDTVDVRRFAATCASASSRLQSIALELAGSLAASSWEGFDSREFRDAWSSHLRPTLRLAAERLTDVVETLQAHAAEQDAASDAGWSWGIDPGGVFGIPAEPSTPPLDPQSPDEILKNYQVSDDTMVEWDPGWFQNKVTITQGEKDMLEKLSLWQKKQFGDCRSAAFDEADRQFPPNTGDRLGQNDNHNDAFRHAYWSALLARQFGADWAEDYTTAHERIPGNEPQREAMDLYNNSIGLKVARAHPNASPEELATLIREAVDRGDMVVIDSHGNLQHSDDVPVGETGHPAPDTPRLPGKDPEQHGRGAESKS